MKATINGIVVEGTPQEIADFVKKFGTPTITNTPTPLPTQQWTVPYMPPNKYDGPDYYSGGASNQTWMCENKAKQASLATFL